MKLLILLAAGVPVFLLPPPFGTLLALGLYLFTLGVISAPLRWGWISFGACSLTVGGLVYGLSMPGEPATHLGPFVVGHAGVRVGLVSMMDVVGFFSVGLLAGRWIRGRDLMPYVSRHPIPFYVVGSFLRTLPTIRDDWNRIRLSQAARGHDLRGRWWRAPAYVPLLVPLFVSTVRRAREQSFALRLASSTTPRGRP